MIFSTRFYLYLYHNIYPIKCTPLALYRAAPRYLAVAARSQQLQPATDQHNTELAILVPALVALSPHLQIYKYLYTHGLQKSEENADIVKSVIIQHHELRKVLPEVE